MFLFRNLFRSVGTLTTSINILWSIGWSYLSAHIFLLLDHQLGSEWWEPELKKCLVLLFILITWPALCFLPLHSLPAHTLYIPGRIWGKTLNNSYLDSRNNWNCRENPGGRRSCQRSCQKHWNPPGELRALAIFSWQTRVLNYWHYGHLEIQKIKTVLPMFFPEFQCFFNFGHLGCQNSLPTQECHTTTYLLLLLL